MSAIGASLKRRSKSSSAARQRQLSPRPLCPRVVSSLRPLTMARRLSRYRSAVSGKSGAPRIRFPNRRRTRSLKDQAPFRRHRRPSHRRERQSRSPRRRAPDLSAQVKAAACLSLPLPAHSSHRSATTLCTAALLWSTPPVEAFVGVSRRMSGTQARLWARMSNVRRGTRIRARAVTFPPFPLINLPTSIASWRTRRPVHRLGPIELSRD
jgi:hypothetical protein